MLDPSGFSQTVSSYTLRRPQVGEAHSRLGPSCFGEIRRACSVWCYEVLGLEWAEAPIKDHPPQKPGCVLKLLVISPIVAHGQMKSNCSSENNSFVWDPHCLQNVPSGIPNKPVAPTKLRVRTPPSQNEC